MMLQRSVPLSTSRPSMALAQRPMLAVASGAGASRMTLHGSSAAAPSLALPAAAPSRSSRLIVQARGASWSSRGQPEIFDRCVAAVTYLLPFMNAFVYVRFLYHQQPLVRQCLQPLLPALSAYNAIPFASFLGFFALYLGIVNNQKMSRFLRFNAMQALLLDIGLILPRLIETVISPPSSGWGAQLYANSQSFIWIWIASWVVYGMANSLMGQYGRIPFVADAVDQQIQ